MAEMNGNNDKNPSTRSNLQNLRYFNEWWKKQERASTAKWWCKTCYEEQKLRLERKKTRECHENRKRIPYPSHVNNQKSLNVCLSPPHDKEQSDDPSDDDSSDDDYVMELNSDFKRFLEESARHREERKKQKEVAEAENDDYIEVNEVLIEATTVAPSQQQGVLRTQEMRKLYGRYAHDIESLETSLQLSFNMNITMRHPVLWPNIPLKF